ncbi:RNA exonuclease [Mucor ambiguus]|uniref:RNA exonuclease n=1 Tax=Mucor ambiguus TaxID=91626 RepID=A0A0C9MNJ5_9FUNG|nr:RNA exonuclease [Mucor ambiguus]
MKFTPIIDKNVVLHDVSKKMHVSFDNVEPTPTATPAKESKKRSHPAHDSKDTDKKKKKHKSDKKSDKKKAKKSKEADAAMVKAEPVDNVMVKSEPIVAVLAATSEVKPAIIAKPTAVATPITTSACNNNNTTTKPVKKATAVSITPNSTKKPNPPPKKNNKAKGKQPPKKLTQEEVLAKVAAIRKKKQLKRQAKVKVDGQVIAKPTFNIIPSNLQTVMPTKQLGEFVLYALSETSNLPWCNIIHKAKVDHVVMMYAQGLNCNYFGVDDTTTPYIDLEQLKESVGKAAMPFLTKQAKYMITNQISGKSGRFNSPVADILQCNMSNSKKERLAKEKQIKMQKYKNNMREFYMVTLEEMKKIDYPIPPFLDPSATLPEGWKETHPALEPLKEGEQKRLIAVDCEMVLTVKGSSLARITLIDEDGSVLLDELVKPDQPIVDYLTRYSGITPARMKTATCSLRRAQKYVRKLVNHNVILVGHGLENDLKALQLAHPYCVDTSLLYDHHRGPPYKPSLRFLTRTYLKRHIQERNQERVGHDSNEDARATLDLFKLKLANKPSFGKFKHTELIMDRLLANRPSRSSAILESSKSDYRSFGSTESGEYRRVDTDEELVDLTLEKVPTTNFLFTRYQAADENLVHRKLEGGEAPDILPTAAKVTSGRAMRLQSMDTYIRRIYQGLPPNSFLIVSGGVNNVPEYKALYDKHRIYQEKYGSKKLGAAEIPKDEQWTEEDQETLCKYAAKARTSTSFFLFKSI